MGRGVGENEAGRQKEEGKRKGRKRMREGKAMEGAVLRSGGQERLVAAKNARLARNERSDRATAMGVAVKR